MGRLLARSILKTILILFLTKVTVILEAAKLPDLGIILTRIEENGAKIHSMKAQLEQKKWTEILKEFDEGESGEFFFLRKQDEVFIRKDIEVPQPSSLLIGNGEVIFFQPVIKQAQRYRLGRNRNKTEFLLLGFGTTRKSFEEAYQMRIMGTEDVQKTPTYILEMIPKMKTAQAYFSKIILWIDKKRWIPIQQKLVEPSDDFLLVQFRNIELNAGLTTRDFKLKFPKGTRFLGLN